MQATVLNKTKMYILPSNSPGWHCHDWEKQTFVRWVDRAIASNKVLDGTYNSKMLINLIQQICRTYVVVGWKGSMSSRSVYCVTACSWVYKENGIEYNKNKII